MSRPVPCSSGELPGRRRRPLRHECHEARFSYANPLAFAEDVAAADLLAGGRVQLGVSRGSPEQVIDGWRYFGFRPAEGESDADMARRHTDVFLRAIEGERFAEPNPRPMFPNPP